MDEAQQLIKESLIKEDKCDEKNGWFIPGTDQKLRDILTKDISKHLSLERDAIVAAQDDDDEDEDNSDEEENSEESEDD